ncbi:MAG: glutamate 5-kinase [Myxococcota bacterium]|jgi:glutamate 5-kinase
MTVESPVRDLAHVRRLVVKVGSSTLADVRVDGFTSRIRALVERNYQVAIVTSGAVAYGMSALGQMQRPRAIAQVQALAAVGQVDLMTEYKAAFARSGVPVAQILLTHESLSNRQHFLNVRNTLDALFSMGVVPIINENDTVATEELRFGDNDRLAAAIATVIDADLVVLLSDIDALYDADPRVEPTARPIHHVAFIDDDVRGVAGDVGSRFGTGGMVSKIEAAAIATEAGIPLVIAAGDEPNVLIQLLDGELVGTLFAAKAGRPDRRRHWIGHLSKLSGEIHVDGGAANALRSSSSSLLAIGVTAVHGAFSKGDGVVILDPEGVQVGMGLAGYDADAMRQIAGLRSDAVAVLLGRAAVDPVVHRNDLVVSDEA